MGNLRRRGGFTLVELLVVVGVILILLTLLLSVTGRARDQSKKVWCASNMRQILAAGLAYSADNDQGPLLPTPNNDTDTFEPLYPKYLNDFRILVCPATENQVEDVAQMRNNARGGRNGTSGHSYEVRSWAVAGVTFPDGTRFNFKALKNPRHFKPNGCVIMDADDATEGDQNNWPDATDNHGREGFNIGFLDGHTEFIRPGRALLEAYLEGYYDPSLPTSIYTANGVIKSGGVFRYAY